MALARQGKQLTLTGPTVVKKTVSRRAFVSAGGAAAALTAFERGLAKQPKSSGRPNILWLVSEDNFPFIGAYGERLARTPAIDALAASGVRYANAFSNAPVCAPSRYAIITGMCPESAGPAHHMRAEGRVPTFLHGFPKYLRDAGYYCTNNVKTDYNAVLDMKAMWDESSEQAHWRNRPGGAPFFAVFNFLTTHESRVFRETPGRVRQEDVSVPAYLPDAPEVRRDIASYHNLMERMDGEVAARLAALDTAGLAEDTIVFYYSDNGGVLPRSKRYCYEAGMHVALIVEGSGEVGAPVAGRAGRRRRRARRADGSGAHGAVDGGPPRRRLTCTACRSRDHGASNAGPICSAARDRMDERYDFVARRGTGAIRYIRNYAPHRIYGQHGAFEWQLDSYRSWESLHRAGKLNEIRERFFREKPAEELYDVVVDPDPVRNLIDAPEHRRRVAKLRAALDAHMVAVNDNGFIPESSPLEGYDAESRGGSVSARACDAAGGPSDLA